MRIRIKNCALSVQFFSGWKDVTADADTTSVIHKGDGYISTSGTFVDSASFSVTEVVKGRAKKIRARAYVASPIGIMTFRNDNDELIGNVVTLASEDLGSTGGYQTIEKDFPTGATKVWLSYSSQPSRMEEFKIELFF